MKRHRDPTSDIRIITSGGRTEARRTKNGPYAGTLLGAILLLVTLLNPAIAHALILTF